MIEPATGKIVLDDGTAVIVRSHTLERVRAIKKQTFEKTGDIADD